MKVTPVATARERMRTKKIHHQSEDGRASAVERLTSRDIVGARLEHPLAAPPGATTSSSISADR